MVAGGAPFSIRDYAARARARAGAADEGRCWPFGGESGPLLPMEVRRFRWWEDEAALAEEDGEEERRMAAKRRKRSIVELFAAVPQVTGGEGLGRGKRVRRKVEKGEIALEAEAKKKGFKKERVTVEIGVKKKGKSSKTKVTSASMSQLFQDAIQKWSQKKSLSKKMGNKNVSILLEKKSMKGNKVASLSSQKVTKSSCHVQSILKKNLKTGMGTRPKNRGVTSPSKPLLKPKHVTFSDGNDVLGRTTSQVEDDTEKSQLLQASQQPQEDGKSQGDDDQHIINEPQFMYQRAGAGLESVEEDTSSTVPVTKSKDKNILGNSVDLNHCLEMSALSNSGNCLSSVSSAVLSRQVLAQNFSGMDSDLNEGLNPAVGVQAEVNCQKYPGSSFSASLAVKARSGDLIKRQSYQPFSSCLVASLNKNDRGRSKMLQERLATVHCRLSKNTVNSVSSCAGSNKSMDAQTTDCLSAHRKMYTSDDYPGLPLNSHGEFVKLYPSSTVDPNGMIKRQFLGEDYVRPSASPALLRSETCMDYAHLKTSHEVQRFCTVDSFGFRPEPYLSPMSSAYGMGFRQSPSSERKEAHSYAVPSNNHPCSNQQELSVECFCPGFMGQDNQTLKSLEMHSCFPRQNYEQNTHPASETTVRLMGKNFTLGTSSKQHRGLDNKNPCPSKQIRDEDHSFQGMSTKAFPRLFHGGYVEPPSTFRNSNGEREYPSCSSVREAELSCGIDAYSFRTSDHNQQPHQEVQNKLYVQPVGRYNETELWHQQPSVENHVLGASEPQLLGSLHHRHTQNAAMVPSYSPKNNSNNLVETRLVHSQFTCFPRQLSNVTQRTPISSFLSGYAVQSTPGLKTPTKFTSLRPLPPSFITSHVYSNDDAQPHGSAPPFHPSISLSDQICKYRAPGDLKDNRSMQPILTKSNHDSSEQMKRGCKRPAGKSDMFLTPGKPCIAVEKDLSMLSLQEERLGGLCGSRPDTQSRGMPVCLSKESEADLSLVNNNTQTAWPYSVNRVGTIPLKLKSGARHILDPVASSNATVDQGEHWPVHSIKKFAVEDDARTVSRSKKRDAEVYRI